MELQISQESFVPNIHLVPMSTTGSFPERCCHNQVNYPIPTFTMRPEKLLILAQVIIPINNFELIGTDIILISNPFEHPSTWNYKTQRIPTSTFNLTWQTGVNVNEDHVIFVGCSSSMPKQPLVMSRILYFSS
eukprot:TRINITY_DN6428_c0_g1_i4.p3 TRINITY_DN6428_c0_g1~~TRINITY_DN6428_c0_g1_i4.p3  ORF type:complete len:133 (-),score=43.30 TRINITY_DN6428_c0_g1_i4:468-866(-)